MKLTIPPHLIKDHGRKSFVFNSISKLFFIFLFLTLSGTELVGQVVIKERVMINPQNGNSDTGSTESLTEWNQGVFYFDTTNALPNNIINLQVGNWGSSGFSPWYFHELSNAVMEFSIIEGNEFGTFIDPNGGGYTDVIQISPNGNVNIDMQLFSNFDPNTSQISVRFEACETYCVIYKTAANIQHNSSQPDNPLTLSIDCPPLPECFPYAAGISHFIANGTIPNNSDALDHFNISIIPDTLAAKDTLAFTEMAKLVIQAMDADSAAVDLDSTKLLSFEVTTNTAFGTFTDPKGDTLFTQPNEPVVLANITYGDAKNGKIKFAAVKANPDSVVKCKIKVTLQADTAKHGKREAVILEQTLKIVMDGEYEVEPIITGKTYDPEHDTYLQNIDDDNRKSFRVSLTRGGEIIKKHKIKLRTNYIDSSGGHDHVAPRRPDSTFTYIRRNEEQIIPTERARRQNYGSFYSYSSGETFNTDSLKGMIYERAKKDTNDRFEYVASIWGDTMKVYLESLENKLLKDSVSIVERIQNILPLEENTNLYELVGSPSNNTNTNDPCRLPESLHSLHYFNHFGTQSLLMAIQNIALEYQELHPGIKLRINDISLEYGGKFDINNNWRGGHASHRIGTNADIGFTGIDNGNCINLNRGDLEQIIISNSSRAPIIEGDHYHIFVNQ